MTAFSLYLLADRRIDLAEKTAWPGGEEPRFAVARSQRDRLPLGEGEGVGYPVIATMCVVLHKNKSSTGAQVRANFPDDADVVAVEVERVGHHHAVERWEDEWRQEVCHDKGDADGGKAGRHTPFLLPECVTIQIDRVDMPLRTEEIGKGQRERARTGPEISPGAICGIHAIAD